MAAKGTTMNTREANFWTGSGHPKIAPEHFNDIVTTAADIAIIVSDTGVIETVIINPLNRTIGKLDHWINRDLADFLAEDSRDRVLSILAEYRKGLVVNTPALEVNHFDNANWSFPIRYTFHPTGHGKSLLMLGRDLQPIAELQQRLVRAQLALEKDYEAHRDYETRYRVLMESTRDALIVADVSSGRIVDLNASAASILGQDAQALTGNLLGSEFDGMRRGELLDRLTDTASSDGSSAIRVTTSRSNKTVSVHPTLFRAAGERKLLCRIESEAKSEGLAAELANNLGALFHNGTDGVVFTDDKGIIRATNDAFLNLCDVALLGDVKGRPLSDFLVRGNVDQKVLLENAARSGKMRMYSTKLLSKHGSEQAVEISATHLDDHPKPQFAFVLRDASRSELMREPRAGDRDEQMANVVELVGSSPLKEIVAATTDVIERMCIQTAVELTGNNRVAAAEMLGLSRQSLYVKLRKYDLLDRNTKD